MQEITNGIAPTAKISSVDKRVNKNMNNKGTTLAAIASRRQFNYDH
ncbi:MAG: hypothetical protein WAM27_05040 [Nitrososphaeraceae archaeon]